MAVGVPGQGTWREAQGEEQQGLWVIRAQAVVTAGEAWWQPVGSGCLATASLPLRAGALVQKAFPQSMQVLALVGQEQGRTQAWEPSDPRRPWSH